ncbi:MAG TPA: hypothetical protein PKA64_17365 [Myxococcota bacterium]|nr:hypothetical protein [Myxococcota bacterium]
MDRVTARLRAREEGPVLGAWVVLWSAWSFAAEPARSVDVEVQLVRASRGEPYVDPALRDELPDLKALPFNRFERLSGGDGRVDQGADREADLGHGVRVSVKILSVDEASSAAAVSIWRDGVRLSGTTVVRPYDRAAVISAGREGDAVLVVPITVRR